MEAQMVEKQDDMQELVTEIARALVDEPGAVVVDAVEREENTVLRLDCPLHEDHPGRGQHETPPSLYIGYP